MFATKSGKRFRLFEEFINHVHLLENLKLVHGGFVNGLRSGFSLLLFF